MRSLEAGAVHLLALAAARLVLLVAMKPDRRQALKAGAIAPPLRGFGLDRLPTPRWGLIKQTRTECERGRARIPKGREAAALVRAEIILEKWVIGWYNYS